MDVYPALYFDPLYKGHLYDCVTKDSYSFHHYEGTWDDRKKEVNYLLAEQYLRRMKYAE